MSERPCDFQFGGDLDQAVHSAHPPIVVETGDSEPGIGRNGRMWRYIAGWGDRDVVDHLRYARLQTQPLPGCTFILGDEDDVVGGSGDGACLPSGEGTGRNDGTNVHDLRYVRVAPQARRQQKQRFMIGVNHVEPFRRLHEVFERSACAQLVQLRTPKGVEIAGQSRQCSESRKRDDAARHPQPAVPLHGRTVAPAQYLRFDAAPIHMANGFKEAA